MDFSELRVGHRLKCVREYELLPFKVDTEYEVVNVNDGRVIICEVGHKDETYPLDISICMDYFEFSPGSSPVVTGFRINKQEKEKEEQNEKHEEDLLSKIMQEISSKVKDEENVACTMFNNFGLNYSLMEIMKLFENFQESCYKDIADDSYYQNIRKYLVRLCKAALQTIKWIDERDEDSMERED